MADLDLERLKRRRSVTAPWELMHFATDEVDAILAALERIPDLEGRVQDKNFELTGVHEALRKETERAEVVGAAVHEALEQLDQDMPLLAGVTLLLAVAAVPQQAPRGGERQWRTN